MDVEFEVSAWPLVIVRIPAVLDTVALRSLFAGFDRVQRRLDKYVVVIDGLQLRKVPNALERKMLTDWMSDGRRTALEKQFNLGSAVVVASGPLRAVLTAINWIRRPPAPQCLVGTMAEGIEWSCERLREGGIPLSQPIEVLRRRA